MSLEVDNRYIESPIPYQKQEDKEVSNGYNAYDSKASPSPEEQNRLIRRLRRTIHGLMIGLVLAIALAVVTAGVAGSLAAKRKQSTVVPA